MRKGKGKDILIYTYIYNICLYMSIYVYTNISIKRNQGFEIYI